MVPRPSLRDCGDTWVGIFHRDPETRMANHFEVVEPIPDGDGFGRVDPELRAHGLDRSPLVDPAVERLQEMRRRVDRVFGGLGAPMLDRESIAEFPRNPLRDRREHIRGCDASDPHRVLNGWVVLDRRDALVGDGEDLKPPLGCRIERMVAHHDVVEACAGVVLQVLRQEAVLGKNRACPTHKVFGESAADDDSPVRRIVHEGASGHDRVPDVIDEVEHVVRLAQRAASRRDDFHARVLQTADGEQIRLAHLSTAIEKRAIEVGDDKSVTHGERIRESRGFFPRPIPRPIARSDYPACVLAVHAANSATSLYAAEGLVLLDAGEAILKGALESVVEVGVIAAPTVARLSSLARVAQSEANRTLLARHQTELHLGGDGARAVAIAMSAVRGGRSAVAVIPASDLVGAVEGLRGARASFGNPEQGLVVVLEDDPENEPMICPRRLAIGAGLPVLEPADLASLRDAIEQALRLSRAGTVPVAIVVHRVVLSSMESVPARPNRVVTTVDELILQRRLRGSTRLGDAPDLLRVARRLELNVATSLPSPGEREVVGFIALGACERALADVLSELQLAGRVPVLRLGLVSPIDDAALQRFIDRVQHVVVLESRPGSAARSVLAVMDLLRRRGVRIPTISYRELPATPEGELPTLGPNDATRPSILVRRIVHLLHAVRPSLSVAKKLLESNPELELLALPARTDEIGVDAALRAIRQVVVELDQEMRGRPELLEGSARPRAIAIDALPIRGDAEETTVVEIYPRERFMLEGTEAVRQSARDTYRRVLIAVDVGRASGGGADLARLADAAIPSDAAARARVMRADLNDRSATRERLTEAVAAVSADETRLVVLVVTDGPPARLDPDAIDRTFVERDRLGYQPQQRLVWDANHACELRPPPLSGLLDEAEEQGATPIEGRFTSEELAVRIEGVEFRATTLSEQVEVVRTKPPMTAYSRGAGGLAPPRPVHGAQGIYRAHIAGNRGATPGILGRILADAGRVMGYRVEMLASDEPCGRGRRAWAQVLWVRARAGESRAPRTAMIPYGEADLVLGVDPIETLRALGPDPSLRVASPQRTSIVANDGPLEDQFDDARVASCELLESAAERCALASQSVVDDFAALCRTNLLSERLLDVALLGVAYQRGLIPVSLEAIEGAVRRSEMSGFGRSFEAFSFGRRLEAGAVVRRSAEERESLERLVRRLALELVRERFGGRKRAARYALSASGMLAAFGRLGNDDDVDRATRGVVTALHRAIVWGGTQMMGLYERLVAGLLRADPSGDLALVGAEPLADAVLVRDMLYVLSMSTSLEQRRRVRERLGVRASHGDKLERRYLSRFELLVANRRFRLDFRTSDWPAEVVRVARPLVPWGLRGDSRAQEVRAYAISLAERAADGFEREPAHWAMCMRRFAMLSADGGVHALSAAELRASVEGL